MKTYLNQQTIEIQRQSYTGNKSAYASIGTFPAYITPLTEKEEGVNEIQFGQGHFVMVDDSIDLRQGDKVIFDGQTHGVQGVKKRVGITLPNFKQALTVRERNI